jgi:hypothetical protein
MEERKLSINRDYMIDTTMMPVELVRKTFLHGLKLTAIYRVVTVTKGPVFMRIDATNYQNEKRAVVIVDAVKFLNAWRANAGPAWLGTLHAMIDPTRRRWFGGPGRDKWLPYLSKASWYSDYKFLRAERGYSHCENSPVPLARVGPGIADGSVSFTNGITRTLWLLAHDVLAFPVECAVESAAHLQNLVGVGWARWLTVKKLISDYSWEIFLEEQQI